MGATPDIFPYITTFYFVQNRIKSLWTGLPGMKASLHFEIVPGEIWNYVALNYQTTDH